MAIDVWVTGDGTIFATHYNRTYEVATARASTVIPEKASMPNFDSQTGEALNCEAFYVYTHAPDVIVTQTGLEIRLPTTAITLERTARDGFAAAKPNVSPVPVRAYVHATCASFNSHHAHVRTRVRLGICVRARIC